MRGRFLDYLVAFMIILCLNFFLPRLLPGDPLEAIYGEDALLQMSAEVKGHLTERFGLDEPMWRQFFAYFARLGRGDLGYSFRHGAPVSRVILQHLPWTFLLVGCAFGLAGLVGFVAGVESAWRHHSAVDRALMVSALSVSGFPSFFIGALFLLFFGVTLGLFPLQGAKTAYSGASGVAVAADVGRHLVLPVLTLAVAFGPGLYLLSRNAMIETIGHPFVLTARAKGLEDRRVRYAHAARNSLLPVVTGAGVMLATRVVTGALFVEMVFSYPGMGTLVYRSLAARDYPVLQGALLMAAVLVIVTNLTLDLLYRELDPRIGHAR